MRQDLLHAGRNTIDLRLWVKDGARGALSGMTVGPEAAVRPLYERHALISVTGPQMIVVVSAGFGLFILLLWLRRRHESMYGYAGLTALAFALFIAGRFVVAEPPLPFPYWGMLVWAGLEAYVVLMCLFALRYGGWHKPYLEALLWAYLVVSPFIDYSAFVGSGGWIPQNWWLMTFVLTAVYVAIFWTIAWRRRTLEALALALAGSVKLVISANERLLPYPIEPAALSAVRLPADVHGDRLGARRSLREIARRIRTAQPAAGEARRRKARRARAQLRAHAAMERQQAIVEERGRIMRDMHDGIGAQLISTLSLVEHGSSTAPEIAAALARMPRRPAAHHRFAGADREGPPVGDGKHALPAGRAAA